MFFQLIPIATVTLEAVIVVVLLAQNSLIRRTLFLSERSEDRIVESERPNLQLGLWSRMNGGAADSTELKRVLIGFTITNASRVDATITEFGFFEGIKIGSNDSAVFAWPQPIDARGFLSNTPRRLHHGEQATVAYRFGDLSTEERDGERVPVRVQPYCRDSLGNVFVMPSWIEYSRTRI